MHERAATGSPLREPHAAPERPGGGMGRSGHSGGVCAGGGGAVRNDGDGDPGLGVAGARAGCGGKLVHRADRPRGAVRAATGDAGQAPAALASRMQESAPRLVMLCGLPGAGKTTLARQLEEEIPALRLSPDEWLAALGRDLWDEPARDRVERLQWDLARRVAGLGGSVILENGYWTRAEREMRRREARALGPNVRVELRALLAPLDELWR